MSEAAVTKNDFRFVLNSVRSESLPAVAQELTTLFPLDLPNAMNIARNAPIILADKLTPQQARSVGTYAVRLKALGADVQVTAQPVGKLQVLRWPLLPDIAKRPGNHLICPSCGARLQMMVHIPAAEPAQGPPAGPEPEPAEEPLPEIQPQPEPAPEPQSAAEPPPPPAEPPPAAPPEPEAEEVVLEPVDEEEELVELADAELILEEMAPAAAPGQSIGGGGACRVTLVGKIKGKKKTQAADLMAYYLEVTPEEAVSMLGKTVVTVAKDLSPEQAEECKNQFAAIGVRVNVKG